MRFARYVAQLSEDTSKRSGNGQDSTSVFVFMGRTCEALVQIADQLNRKTDGSGPADAQIDATLRQLSATLANGIDANTFGDVAGQVVDLIIALTKQNITTFVASEGAELKSQLA